MDGDRVAEAHPGGAARGLELLRLAPRARVGVPCEHVHRPRAAVRVHRPRRDGAPVHGERAVVRGELVAVRSVRRRQLRLELPPVAGPAVLVAVHKEVPAGVRPGGGHHEVVVVQRDGAPVRGGAHARVHARAWLQLDQLSGKRERERTNSRASASPSKPSPRLRTNRSSRATESSSPLRPERGGRLFSLFFLAFFRAHLRPRAGHAGDGAEVGVPQLEDVHRPRPRVVRRRPERRPARVQRRRRAKVVPGPGVRAGERLLLRPRPQMVRERVHRPVVLVRRRRHQPPAVDTHHRAEEVARSAVRRGNGGVHAVERQRKRNKFRSSSVELRRERI
eukprot:213586-Pyramimonas_sp.AAC.1